MIQCGCSASLAHEALVGLLILSDAIRQELEGDVAAKLGVLGLVHHSHSTTAQFF